MDLETTYSLCLLDVLEEQDVDRWSTPADAAAALTHEYNERVDYLDGRKAVSFYRAYLVAQGALLSHLVNGLSPEAALIAARDEVQSLEEIAEIA